MLRETSKNTQWTGRWTAEEGRLDADRPGRPGAWHIGAAGVVQQGEGQRDDAVLANPQAGMRNPRHEIEARPSLWFSVCRERDFQKKVLKAS